MALEKGIDISVDKIQKFIFNLVILSIVFFASMISAQADTYYVSNSGINGGGNDGSQGLPWATIDYAIGNMSGGDTLKIEPGTYTQSGVIRLQSNLDGTVGAPTVIEGTTGNADDVEIVGNSNAYSLLRIESDNTTIRDLTIDGNLSNSAVASGDDQCVIARPNSASDGNLENVVIDNLLVTSCSSHGIDIGGQVHNGTQYYTSGEVNNTIIQSAALNNYNGAQGSSGWASGLKVYRGGRNITLTNNELRNNWGEGVAITRGENVTFENNNIYNNFNVNIYIDNSINTDVLNNFSYCIDGGAAILYGGNKASGISIGEEDYSDNPNWGNQLGGLIVANNLVYNCARGFTWFGTYVDVATGGLDNAVIANNTFYLVDNSSSALYLDGEVQDNIQFKNNIIRTAAGGAWIDNQGNGGSYDFDYNYWVNSANPSQALLQGSNDVLDSLANVDFEGAAGTTVTNFQIGALSSAIDEGISITGITQDYFGGSRDANPDIGFHEYGSVANTTSYIMNLDAGLNAVNRNSGESLEQGGTGSGSSTQETRIIDSNNSLVIADIEVNMSSDNDWAGVTGEVNLVSGKSYVHNLTSAPGTAANYTLYVPRSTGENAVIICPGANNINAVNDSCPSAQTYTLASGNVNIVNVGGQDYWTISGLSGTGGESIIDATGVSDTMTRQQISVTSNHTVELGIAVDIDQPGDTFTLDFDDLFNLTGLTISDIDLLDDGVDKTLAGAAGADIWGVTINTGNSSIVFTAPTSGTDYIASGSGLIVRIGTNATGGSNQITNPPTVGTYALSLNVNTSLSTADATIQLAIIDDDSIEITGFIQELITFDIDTTSDMSALTLSNCDATGGASPCDGHSNPIALGQFDATGYTVSLGNLISTDYNESGDTVVHQDGNTGQINTIGLDLTANLNGGVFVTVESLNGALDNSGNQIASPAGGVTVDLNTQGGYGLRFLTANAVLGTISAEPGYGGAAGIFGGVNTGGFPEPIFGSNNSYLDEGRILLSVGARTLGTEPVGTYTDSLTFVAVPQF